MCPYLSMPSLLNSVSSHRMSARGGYLPTPLPSLDPIGLPMLEWVTIPAGKVTLETGWDDKFQDYSTKPLATFEVAPFAISKYPVTNAQFVAFIDDNGYSEQLWWQGLSLSYTKIGDKRIRRISATRPCEGVSWNEAIAFCRWLSAKREYNIDLPNEMQWQRAAQGDDTRQYPWGNEFNRTKCNTFESGNFRTTPVDSYTRGQSPFGVFHMAGNVWQWCLNEYNNPLQMSISGDHDRAARGGSFCMDQRFARAAYRLRVGPGGRPDCGFRVMCPSLICSGTSEQLMTDA